VTFSVADEGYRGELIKKTKAAFGFILEIVLRPDESSKKVQSYPIQMGR
jgi:hypothetical protein